MDDDDPPLSEVSHTVTLRTESTEPLTGLPGPGDCEITNTTQEDPKSYTLEDDRDKEKYEETNETALCQENPNIMRKGDYKERSTVTETQLPPNIKDAHDKDMDTNLTDLATLNRSIDPTICHSSDEENPPTSSECEIIDRITLQSSQKMSGKVIFKHTIDVNIKSEQCGECSEMRIKPSSQSPDIVDNVIVSNTELELKSGCTLWSSEEEENSTILHPQEYLNPVMKISGNIPQCVGLNVKENMSASHGETLPLATKDCPPLQTISPPELRGLINTQTIDANKLQMNSAVDNSDMSVTQEISPATLNTVPDLQKDLNRKGSGDSIGSPLSPSIDILDSTMTHDSPNVDIVDSMKTLQNSTVDIVGSTKKPESPIAGILDSVIFNHNPTEDIMDSTNMDSLKIVDGSTENLIDFTKIGRTPTAGIVDSSTIQECPIHQQQATITQERPTISFLNCTQIKESPRKDIDDSTRTNETQTEDIMNYTTTPSPFVDIVDPAGDPSITQGSPNIDIEDSTKTEESPIVEIVDPSITWESPNVDIVYPSVAQKSNFPTVDIVYPSVTQESNFPTVDIADPLTTQDHTLSQSLTADNSEMGVASTAQDTPDVQSVPNGDLLISSRDLLGNDGNDRETESGASTPTKSTNKRNKKKRARTKKKLNEAESLYKNQKQKASKFAESVSELLVQNTDVHESLSCPICWEVYYNAYTCQPCSHIFCEPCLRRLAKYCSDAKTAVTCPMCRQPINFCIKDYELTSHVQQFLPDDYHRRRVTDGRSRYMNHPLPSKPHDQPPTGILQMLAVRRQQRRQQSQRVGYTPVRLNLTRFISIAMVFVLFKSLAVAAIAVLYNLVNTYVTGTRLTQYSGLLPGLSAGRRTPMEWLLIITVLIIIFVTGYALRYAYVSLKQYWRQRQHAAN